MTNKSKFELFIKNTILQEANQLKGKYAPLSEIIDKIPRTLSIKKIYNLTGKLKDYFFIMVRNHKNNPKIRYFIAYKLASQSSDFLVQLAKTFAKEHNLNLIQYSIYPQLIGRISLLSFIEIKSPDEYSKVLEIFELFRNNFRTKMITLKKIVEHE